VSVMRLPDIVARLRSEDGGVVLAFALMLPGLLLLTALALEIGNWYEHRRHLQLQTDAGALAAGQLFRRCVLAPDSALNDMTLVAAQYGGDKQTLTALGASTPSWSNLQVGSTGATAGNVRSFSYQGTAYPPDYTAVADTNPCTSGAFDIRATEDDISHIFALSPTATVHAHSRVEMKAVNQMKGLLPLAVPDVRPNYVFATFIDESTGQPLAGCPSGCTEQLVRDVSDSRKWVPKDTPLAVPISAAHIGVRLRLVGGANPDQACGTLFTECYDATSPNGIVHVRGWSSVTAAPNVRDAYLLSGSCTPDAYFAAGDCSAGFQAEISLDDHPLSGNGASATITATTDSGSVALTHGTGTTWSANSGLGVTGAGPHWVSLDWSWSQTAGTWRGKTCKATGGNPCTDSGTFANVQRAYVASPDSGPVQLAQVYESGVNTSGANSFQIGTTHTLGVTIKTLGTLLLSQPTDAPIYLRVFNDTGSASQNQSLNCDKDGNLETEFQTGCVPYYIKNPSLTCPGGPASNLWDMWYVNNEPLPCALVKTGASVGQISRGLNTRFYGTATPAPGDCSSHPVNWIRNQGFDENAHPDDRRAIPLIVTPLGTFGGSGSDQVPVIDFGYFYVTGYKGDPCEGVDPNQDPVPNNRGSYVQGHFVKFFPLDGVVASSEKCDLMSITPCLSVLTR
jgi:Flp pilus assembly protein TadG